MTKLKFAGILAALAAFTPGISSAVTVTLSGVANPGVGSITQRHTPTLSPGGRVIFISVTDGDAFRNAVYNSVNLMLGASPAEFDSLLAAAIGTTSASSPGIVRTATYTNGAFTSSGSTEMGAVGNSPYMFIVDEAFGGVAFLGLYRTASVPASGTVSFTPSSSSDTGMGTSDGGFQLIGIPEPTTALLGMWSLGLAAFHRRRR